MQYPEGATFQTANGNLSLYEFGELVSQVWKKVYPSVPMYPVGTPSEQVGNVYITWGCASRRTLNAKKSRTVDEFTTDSGDAVAKRIGLYRCVLEVRVSSDSPEEANKLIEAFEQFVEQYTGEFKKAGVRELLYLERLPDSYSKDGAVTMSHRTVQYEVHEQTSLIETGPVITDIQIIAERIRSQYQS